MTRQAHASARPNFAFKPSIAALAVATCFLQPTLVIANPTGAQVAAGSAQFATNGNTLTVTNAPNTIINWQQFNIGAGETTRFQQQGASSAILNRVVGNNPSQIYGTLSSNGQVFLINQNGILVGPNAIIDVNRLVLSTLNLTDANFLNKTFSFSGGGYGQLLNQGKISTPLGGSVYLVGADVRNEGIITSPQGQVVLAAGNTVSMTDTAGPELTVTVSANGNKAVNLGTVTAAGGQINMFGALIEQQGVLSADSASVDAQGRIILKASDSTTVSGTLSATNSAGKGGDIQVLGNNVTLTSTANLDASGATGGGTVLVGGDWQGKNPDLQNATTTTMQAGAVIKADATENGNGGKVVLWADNTTDFKGSIFARGGPLGGNGGQVETSGKQNLLLGGSVNTLAPLGQRGFWLLDPQAYCIDNAGSFCTGYIAATVITTGNLATMLNSSDVTLQATDYIVLGDVTLNSYGFTRAGAKLSLIAPSVQQLMNFSSGIKLNLSIKAAGTSSTYASKSGQADAIGSIYTFGGNLLIEAEKRIVADGSSSTVWLSTEPSPNPYPYDWLSSGVMVLSAPDVIALGAVRLMNRGNDTTFIANKIGGSGTLLGDLGSLDIQTYTSGFNIYIARPNTDPACGSSGLCISNQFANITGRELYFVSGRCAIQNIITDTCGFNTVSLDGDIFIGGFGSSWSAPSIPRDYLGFIGKNITLAQPIGRNGANSQRPDQHVLGFIATEKFTNLVGTNPFPNLVAGKLWSITVGDYTGSNFGGLESLAQRIDLATWSDRESYDDGGTNNWNNSLFPRNSNAIFVVGAGAKQPIIDPCLQNPASCNSSATNPAGTQSTQGYTPALNGPLTIAAELTADERYIARGDKAGDDKRLEAKLTQSDKKPKSDQEKTAEEVRQEAKQARADAAGAEAEAKQAEAEAKQAEAEVKAARTPEQRATAQRRAEAKRAQADVLKARAAAKLAESESREALADTKQIASGASGGTTARRADAESRQIRAEEKRAEAQAKQATAESKFATTRAKQAEAEAKQAEADVRAAKTPEQKLAATQRAEVKKAESQALKAEGEARKTEAEGKQIEAQAKKAEADARKAESDAKLAKTPQKKLAAEKRAEVKKAEAEVKKAEAAAKQGEADAKQAKAEARHAEADAKAARSPGGRAVHEKRAEAKKAEGDAKEAQAQVKKAEADEKRARAAEKQARAEARAEKNAQKKAAAEQKAEQKKAEADKKQAEVQAKKAEAEAKQAAAEKKAEEQRVAETKRNEERRAESAKAFGKIAAAGASRDSLAAVVGLRHELKTEALQPALSILERNPNAASLPPCSAAGSSVVCIPDGMPLQTTLPDVRIPSLSFLPQIERKRALVIGINQYKDGAIPSLETALPDARAVGQQLRDQLGYDVIEVPDASRADIISSLNRLAREVGPNDSVTVYYAGHGYLSEKTGQGYWIPGDAQVTRPDNWITNNDIAKLLGNIPARQVLLVSDSCYSGSLTRQQWTGASRKLDPNSILAKRSVTVMSSGGEEPVSDEGKDGHSIFAYNFIKSLQSVDKVDSAGQIFENVKREVTREFPQTPQYGGAVSAGHATGADYLFEKRVFK